MKYFINLFTPMGLPNCAQAPMFVLNGISSKLEKIYLPNGQKYHQNLGT